MANRSLATDEAAQGEYRLSEQDRQSLQPRPAASIPPKKLEIVERQRRRFIQRFGCDGLLGSASAEVGEFCSKTLQERKSS